MSNKEKELRPMTKSEFVSKYINDLYNRRLLDKKASKYADDHIFENINRIKRRTNGR